MNPRRGFFALLYIRLATTDMHPLRGFAFVQSLLRHLYQFFPDFHHRPGVELAVAEEVLSGSFGFAARHGPDFREDVHGLRAVVDIFQVAVI